METKFLKEYKFKPIKKLCMSRHRQWRAWQFARRHRNQDMLGSMMSSGGDGPFTKWFWRQRWYVKVAVAIGLAALMLVLFYSGVLIALGIFAWVILWIKAVFF